MSSDTGFVVYIWLMLLLYTPEWVTQLVDAYSDRKAVSPESLAHLKARLQPFFNPENPDISIVLIAYNEERLLTRTLASIANQRMEVSAELILVNNNSTDDTSAILNQLGVREVKETIPGPGAARQAGLTAARAPFVLFGDADTLYPETWAQEHYSRLQLQGVVVSYGRYSFVPDEGKSRFKLAFWEWIKDLGYDFKNLSRPEMCVFGCSFAVVRLMAIQEGFNLSLRRGEDGYMAFKMKAYGKLKMLRTSSSRAFTDVEGMQINDQSLFLLAWKRIFRELKRVWIYFGKEKGDYRHTDESLMKPNSKNNLH